MSQKRHTVDQIIAKLRRVDVLLGKGTFVHGTGRDGCPTVPLCGPWHTAVTMVRSSVQTRFAVG